MNSTYDDKKINYNYMKEKKATVLKKWHNHDFIKKDFLNIESFENATNLPLKKFKQDSLLFGRGGVVDKNGNYVEISAINNRVQFLYDFQDEECKDETIVYCGYLANQWGHFLIESVARL